MTLRKIQDTTVSGKKILLRLDLDVPLTETGEIADATRLKAGEETLHYLLNNHATVVVAGHLGRPKGEVKEKESLASIALWYAKKFNLKVETVKLQQFTGWKLADNFFILENLRFFEGEETDDDVFAQSLAALADIYVDDAFAVAHRNAASNVGITKFLPSFAGIQLQKEVEGLGKVLENPQRPLVVIVGGAKLETKLPLVEKMHHFADFVLVGGKLVQETQDILKMQHEQLPPSPSGQKSVLLVADPNADGLDITQNSVENFLQVIANAKTVVWNGPVGKTGKDATSDSEKGSTLLAQGIINSGAYAVVGGGDTLEFLDSKKLLEKFSFASTGGGAMLSFLSGEPLPALIPLIA
jgi:phosphoglycerate kinase